ncbi:MAG: hypothetical protein K8F30_07165 [Taibaiella sp.]|nr:hypothetical protein [Taibaiella sp.]
MEVEPIKERISIEIIDNGKQIFVDATAEIDVFHVDAYCRFSDEKSTLYLHGEYTSEGYEWTTKGQQEHPYIHLVKQIGAELEEKIRPKTD